MMPMLGRGNVLDAMLGGAEDVTFSGAFVGSGGTGTGATGAAAFVMGGAAVGWRAHDRHIRISTVAAMTATIARPRTRAQVVLR